jgi:peroxiredoxin
MAVEDQGGALPVGAAAPAERFVDTSGASRSVVELGRGGPVVLLFYRGVW